jgi:hypothetical protein
MPTGVPEQMPDAAAKVQEEAEDAADEQNPSEQRPDEVLHDGIGLRSCGGCNQPRDQRDGVNANVRLRSAGWVKDKTEVSCGR